jgi:hypothetical protein
MIQFRDGAGFTAIPEDAVVSATAPDPAEVLLWVKPGPPPELNAWDGTQWVKVL